MPPLVHRAVLVVLAVMALPGQSPWAQQPVRLAALVALAVTVVLAAKMALGIPEVKVVLVALAVRAVTAL